VVVMIIVVMASFGGRGVLKVFFFTAPKRSCRLTVDARTALLASLNRMTSLYTVKHHYDFEFAQRRTQSQYLSDRGKWQQRTIV
jgi:hypothetical protein